MTILIVDDETTVRDVVKLSLKKDGYVLLEADSGQSALDLINRTPPDLVVLDYMMPDVDGLAVLEAIRSNMHTKGIPVLFLTASSDDDVIIECFRSGADSYLTKPFSVALLRMQIAALLQHSAQMKNLTTEFNFHSLQLAPGKLSVSVSGMKIAFTPKEIELLKYFLENQNQILTRDAILENVWGYSFDSTRTVDCHVSRLREKLIGCPEFVEALHSVRGSGYCLGAIPSHDKQMD